MQCGAHTPATLDGWLDQLATQPAWQPFDERAGAFVGQFSRRLLTHPRIREFPELAALGHWFRPARVRDFATRYAASPDARQYGRGLVFHLAPSNVDAVSMYSWLLSLLAGNTNLVRVSRQTGPQLEFVFSVLQQLLDDEVGADIAPRIVLLTYAHDAEVTARISARCQARVVWGGDATVAEIRRVPLRPTAVELAFPDRFSLAALDAETVLNATDDALIALASAFYNDAFWFAQQACSSPRVLYWIGADERCAPAQTRFWDAVSHEVARRAPENSPAMAMARTEAAFLMAAAGAARATTRDATTEGVAFAPDMPLRLALEHGMAPAMKSAHCGNGLFLEARVASMEALASELTDREQTLSVFGFSDEHIDALVAALPPRALDRIVPIGSALDFDVTWDGIDLITALTRRISITRARR